MNVNDAAGEKMEHKKMNKCLSCKNFINGVIKRCAKYPRIEYYGELTANPLVAMCGEFERKIKTKDGEK